ncbi:hypothetical protein PZH33_20650, partial [Blautia schinkii]|uniref:hypothetical protein n=1 Tax=Blautia schinkii TaxID=180164 RepID=UPI0023AE70B0
TIYCQEENYEEYIAAAAHLSESDCRNEAKRLQFMDLSDLKCEAAPQKEFFFCQSVFLPVIDNSRCFMLLYGILES